LPRRIHCAGRGGFVKKSAQFTASDLRGREGLGSEGRSGPGVDREVGEEELLTLGRSVIVFQSAREIISEIVKKGMVPPLKIARFRKYGMRFQRRLNDVVQIVGVQLSQGNFADMGRFYVNVGLGFDKLWSIEPTGILERPKEGECHYSVRLHDVVPQEPQWYPVSSATDVDKLAAEMANAVKLLLTELDTITSTEAMIQRGWLRIGAHRILKARLHYVNGDLESALADLKYAAEFFADRQGMSLNELIVRHKLNELERLL
jgi:hypothetical protein